MHVHHQLFIPRFAIFIAYFGFFPCTLNDKERLGRALIGYCTARA